MQTLWARVAQVRGSCRCPQCLPSARAVSGRTTASATRSTPTYWTSSTLWYSGIFAAAATFDAGVKIHRREKWDLAIAEVKQELERPVDAKQEQLQGTTAPLGHEETLQASETNLHTGETRDRKLERLTWSESDAGQVVHARMGGDEQANTEVSTKEGNSCGGITIYRGEEALEELQANTDSSTRRRARPSWPANTGPDLNVRNLPPQSIYSPDHYKLRAEGRRWTPRKLDGVELAIDVMQLSLLRALRAAGWSEEAASAVPPSYAEMIMMSTKDINARRKFKLKQIGRYYRRPRENAHDALPRAEGDIQMCKYHQDDMGECYNIVHELNRSLEQLFSLCQSKVLTLPAVLAKICYNLSCSSAPPDVDTYNIMMIGFSSLRQLDRVRDVIAAFGAANMRPNEVSLASTLNFYTATGDVQGFTKHVQKIRGKFGGLMEARPDIHITAASEGRLIRKPTSPERIIQLPYPTPMVFGALIKGVLKFSGFDVALDICEGMAHSGWGLCIRGMSHLLTDCANRNDWSSGLAVWQQIQRLKWKSKRRRGAAWTEEQIPLATYASMLRLCIHCKQRNVWEDVMDQAVRTHPNATERLLELVEAEGDEAKFEAGQPQEAESKIHADRGPRDAGEKPREHSGASISEVSVPQVPHETVPSSQSVDTVEEPSCSVGIDQSNAWANIGLMAPSPPHTDFVHEQHGRLEYVAPACASFSSL